MVIIVGIPGPETEHIQALIIRKGITDRVHLLAGLSESALQWCYRHCEALIAPSLAEGFGLPVAEALLAGCRVVCSDIPVFREFGGKQCHYVPVRDISGNALADAIANALQQRKPQPSRLPQLSSQVLSEQYVALYQQLMATATTRKTLHFLPRFS